ncbi:hypothetical protein GE061_005408 [Apolygus lucorum]|uniref:RNase H type-1 domain-containing protein n=1 Tax=Apolygus lucorum TaxID=248454 RepID=A0A8S9WXZ0_APOLU|nr:hypothetical protein GE061_005408 [Apolygus lucorum]
MDVDALAFLKGTRWGNHPDDQMILYKSVILPKINYGAFTYLSQSANAVKHLQCSQNAALRKITGMVRTTSVFAIHTITGMLPMEYQARYAAHLQLTNLYVNNTTARQELIQLHAALYLKYSAKYNKLETSLRNMIDYSEETKLFLPNQQQLQYTVPKGGWGKYVTESIPGIKKGEGLPARQLAIASEFLHARYPEHTLIFTDGSKGVEGAAGAMWCGHHGLGDGVRLHKLTTSYQAEIEGLTLAMTHIKLHVKSKNIVILTDSKSALQAIRSLTQHERPPLCLLRLLQQLQARMEEGYTLHLQFVPSHIGLEGNEKADREAGRVRRAANLLLGYRTIYSDCSQEMMRRLREEWRTEYGLRGGPGEWTRAIFGKPADKPWFHNHRELSNKQITDINRILSGHANNNQFKNRMKPATHSPICNQCDSNAIQTVPHTLTECSKHQTVITSVLDEYSQINEYLTAALEDTDKLVRLHEALMESGAPL